jgi:hypothetical protein
MRTRSQSPLSLEEHRELSVELHRTSARLRELQAMVTGIYGVAAANSFAKAIESVERVCVEMQAQAVKDCPGSVMDKLYR